MLSLKGRDCQIGLMYVGPNGHTALTYNMLKVNGIMSRTVHPLQAYTCGFGFIVFTLSFYMAILAECFRVTTLA